jgi:hypothetical protein
VYWPGLEPGSCKQYALSGKIERRLRRLLQALAQNWGDLELNHHREAEYDDYGMQLVVRLKGAKRRDPDALTAYVWFEADEDDEETYLLAGWYAKRKRLAKDLAKQASRFAALKLPGIRVPEIDDHQWYIRGLQLSQIEHLQAQDQMARVVAFVKETFARIEQSGILAPFGENNPLDRPPQNS